jgi:uncharacterized protein (DUF362 family)/Pyruvate/2-oxoacid:ferredoxin oxidoreductase delta subunit
MVKVAAVKVDSFDYNYEVVEKGIQEALSLLGGLDKFISPGDKVLLKPNMVEGVDKSTCVTTHPEVVRAVIRAVKALGATPFVGDSPGIGGTRRVAEKCGILGVCVEEGAELLPFDTGVERHFSEGRILKKMTIADAVHKVDKIISLAKMKTHSFMGITGAVKNQFGFVVGSDKAQFHLRMKMMPDFAGMLIDLTELVKPVLFIVDGIMGMEGNGPRNGQPKEAGVLLAGANPFAVDAVMAAIMGFDAGKLPVGKRAKEWGYISSIDEVELAGSAKELRLRFIEPKTYESMDTYMPPLLVRFFQSQFTARPKVSEKCIGCGRCAEHCPPKAMIIAEKRAVIDYDKCIRCYCCQELCPANAIELKDRLLLKLVKLSRKKRQV